MMIMLLLLSVNAFALDSTRIQIAFIVNGDTLDPILDGNLEIDDKPVLSSSSARRDSIGVELSLYTEHKFRLTYDNVRIEHCIPASPMFRRYEFEITKVRSGWFIFGKETISATLMKDFHKPTNIAWPWQPIVQKIPVTVMNK